MIFGFTEAQISGFFLTYGVGAFIAYMLFIIGQLAWESKAGRFGTFVLYERDGALAAASRYPGHEAAARLFGDMGQRVAAEASRLPDATAGKADAQDCAPCAV
mgnify:CR=1 FL=1